MPLSDDECWIELSRRRAAVGPSSCVAESQGMQVAQFDKLRRRVGLFFVFHKICGA